MHYHAAGDWYVRLLLLMPDHLHALIAPAPDKQLRTLIADWKRFVTSRTGVVWQKNFFDHRLRSGESWEEKAAYIRANPLRAGLIAQNDPWEFQIEN
jgi:REP element-mobilizing transposase RayT